jgi:hypothetical protein
MITTKRFDYKEKKYRNKVVPAFYEIYYFWNGKNIAWFSSKDNTLYLNARMLGNDFKKSYFERMNESKYKEAFEELVNFLSLDRASKLSEFMNM